MVQTVSTHVGNRAANRTALVLGATGGVGGAIAARLMREGWQVRALCRNADAARSGWRHDCPAPQFVTGDAMDGASVVRAATLGDGVAAIVHAVNPPGYRNWSSLVLPMMTIRWRPLVRQAAPVSCCRARSIITIRCTRL